MVSLKLVCPRCNGVFSADSEHAGRQVMCPLCEGQVTVPAAPSPVVSPAGEQTIGEMISPADPLLALRERQRRRTQRSLIVFALSLVLLLVALAFLIQL